MASLRTWWQGARPRTLGAGVVPVVVGAVTAGSGDALRALACGVVAVGLQVGVNLANDAADGSRGIDLDRLGPKRLVASGAASARAVWVAAAIAILIASASGLWLAVVVGPELLVLGAACILALLGYSAGPRPYASLGLGEVMVFLFFGPVAVVGTAYAMTQRLPVASVWASVPVGLLAVAIMLANNIRDIPSDEKTGKRTLCVRLGDRRSRTLFRSVLLAALIAVPLGVAVGGLPAPTLLSLAAWPLAATPWREGGTAAGVEWIRILNSTALLHAHVGLAIAIGAAFS